MRIGSGIWGEESNENHYRFELGSAFSQNALPPFPKRNLNACLFLSAGSLAHCNKLRIHCSGSRLESVASGYWTTSAKRLSGLCQPLGFESLTLRRHSIRANVLDIGAAGVILNMFRGRRSSIKLKPRGDLLRGFRLSASRMNVGPNSRTLRAWRDGQIMKGKTTQGAHRQREGAFSPTAPTFPALVLYVLIPILLNFHSRGP
jgi:hypothetical protein